MAMWYDDPNELWEAVWRVLERGVAEHAAPARHPVLATAGLEGGAEARVVVLRGASRDDVILEVHTDTASAKIGQLAQDSKATLLVWDPQERLQIRVRAHVEVSKGAGVTRVWDRLPEASRNLYGIDPPPGQWIALPDAFEPSAKADRFAVLTVRAFEMDVVFLGADEHRRALFRAAANWHAVWLSP